MSEKPKSRRTERMSGEERREAVLEAAIVEFATYGLHGASTENIAERVGISQPYVFRLFGTKKELFLAAANRVCDRVLETWEAALEDEPEDRLLAMGRAYVELMFRRDELLLLLQAFAASKDPDVLRMSRKRMEQLYGYVERVSGESDERVQQFFAQGMLLTVAAGLNLDGIFDKKSWVSKFLGFDKERAGGASNPDDAASPPS
jgi:AcrR family transcriptional regulator